MKLANFVIDPTSSSSEMFLLQLFIFLITCKQSFMLGCGGDITKSKGDIVPQGYPYPLPPNTTCVWLFKPSPPAKWLFIHFNVFTLTEDSFLSIQEKNVNSTHVFKGIKGLFSVAVDANSILTFKTMNSNASTFHAGFSNQDCSVSIMDEHGIVMSPVYSPRPYQDSFICSWDISGSSNDKSMLISFATFQLQNNSIKIYQDTSTLIASYTGNAIPQDVIISSNLLRLQIQIQVSSPVVVFISEFSVVNLECSKVLPISDTTIISTNILRYEPTKCVWILKSKPGTTLMTNIDYINVQNLQDEVLFNDGTSRYSTNVKMIDFKTENISGSFVTSSSNSMYVSLFTVPVLSLSSFRLNVSVQLEGGTLYDHGEFYFPQSPILKSQSVIYTLIVNTSLQVEVSLEAQNLQDSNQIYFYDMQENKEELLVIFTKESEFRPVFSKSNKVVIILKGFDGSESLRGKFHGSPLGCDVLDNKGVGIYELPKVRNENCTWLVKPTNVSEGDVIAITFSKLILNNDDMVAVYRGLSNGNENLVQVFNYLAHGQPQLYIDGKYGIRVDSQIGSGKIPSEMTSFFEIQQGCNRNYTLKSGERISISSTGYPSHYPLNMNCFWRIFLPKNSTAYFSFADVNIYRENILAVYSVSNQTAHLIESVNAIEYPDDIITTDDEIIVEWNSTSAHANQPVRGFLINIHLLECGGNITTLDGKISTPDFPNPVNESLECIWSVTVPQPKSEIVNIIQFDVDVGLPEEVMSVLEIFDGGSLTSSVIITERNVSSLSRTNKMLVKYTNNIVNGSSYRLSYTSKECSRSEQCRNGICMHNNWRCNGINNCGDFSDEENCDSLSRSATVSVPVFATCVILSLIAGIVGVIFVPQGIRKIRDRFRREEQGSFSILPDEIEDVG